MLQHIFFFIGKVNSLRANRLEKGYTRSIPNPKKQKAKGQTSLILTWWLASLRNLSKTKWNLYIHPSLIHKSVQKNGFNILIVPLNIIEGPPIPFFPDGPHQAEGGSSPSFLPFLAHKRSMPTQEVSFHRGVHHPLHPKKREDQKP